MTEDSKVKILSWLNKHGIELNAPGDFDKLIYEIDALDSLIVMALIIEIEEITHKKIPNNVLINSNQISINQIINSVSDK
jgi:acyl carrier protein